MPTTTATTVCPACLSTDTKPAFLSSPDTFSRCRSCRSLFDAAPPSADAMREIYEGRDYFVKDEGDALDHGYAEDYLANQADIEAKFDQVLQHLERYAPPGRLLDVGAGPGFLVTAATQRSWDATGIDLNPWAVEHGQRELAIDLRLGTLDDDTLPGEQFDAITLMDVIEHVTDPDSILRNVARLLRPGGAFALLTPDAGAPVSRVLGRRWPEVRRPGEHVVLFSVAGLTAALRRHGLEVSGWHSIGKVAPLATLVADASLTAPGLTRRLHSMLEGTRLGERRVNLDPRTKFVLYGRRRPDRATPTSHRPAKVPRSPEALAHVDAAILDELEELAKAKRLTAWLFDEFAHLVPGASVLEVGAGIGTFSQRMLDEGAKDLVLVEPEPSCAGALHDRFDGHPQVRVSEEALPDAPSIPDDHFGLVVCQNVLEHIGDDQGALDAMARTLRPGGHLALVVPAGPGLFGALDDAYGHWRRYDADTLRAAVTRAGLEVRTLHAVNALGVLGWWTKNRRPGARIGSSSLRAYEMLVAGWRPIEEALSPRHRGLSLVCIAQRPDEA